MDIGTGDGAYVLRRARACPERLFIGIDSNARGLAECSRKAARKVVRGGAPYAMFVHAAAERLPRELDGLAGEVTILNPWGSLLDAVVRPDAAVLASVRRLCRPGGTLRIVFSHDLEKETFEGLGSAAELPARLYGPYKEAGFEIRTAELPLEEARRIPASWSKRLSYGRGRRFYVLRGAADIGPIARGAAGGTLRTMPPSEAAPSGNDFLDAEETGSLSCPCPTRARDPRTRSARRSFTSR